MRFELKRTLYLSFIVFYVASSYAVSQERVRLIVEFVQHTTSHDNHVQIEADGNQVRDGFPNYRQAKPKTVCVLDFGLVPQLRCLPPPSDGFMYVDPTVRLQLRTLSGSVLSRAPPIES
jgi:hypothetical protein